MRELVMLSALAALGCGLAAMQGDLAFVAIFGADSVPRAVVGPPAKGDALICCLCRLFS